MPRGRRYFILSDPLPKSEIPHLLGRVVEDKTHPNRSFAPVDTNPDDFIPGILPKPVTWESRREFYSDTSEWSLAGGLADLVSLEQGFGTEVGASLESDEVKSYMLSNTLLCFQKLMSYSPYSNDVRDLLKRSKSSHAYFVTGFLTAKDGVLSHFKANSRTSTVELTAPVLQAAGVPIPVGNPQVAPSTSTERRQERSMTIVEEVVFAVAYDVIRTSRSLDFDARGFLKTSIINSGPKRAKPKHMAFGAPEYDVDEWDSDDDESGYYASTVEEEEEISFVNTEANWDDGVDGKHAGVGSFFIPPKKD